MYRLWRHFDFHARSTKQNFFSETTERSQSCNKKKQNITCDISSKLTIQILSSPNRFSRWGSNESRLFSRSIIVHRRRSYIFAILTFPEEKRSSFRNYKSPSILTKYSNRLTDQPLRKHYSVKLDLDGLRKRRYPRITKTATKRVSVLSLCCDQRQETFVSLGLFQTTTNL